jgi:hypothetical protein
MSAKASTKATGIEAEREADAMMLQKALAEGRVLSLGELWDYALRDLKRVHLLVGMGRLPHQQLDDAYRRIDEVREMMKDEERGGKWPN